MRQVFLTGPAGVGKSFIIGELRRMLDHVGIRYATTAPTGIAALNINGRTLHSWASMGLAQGRTADLYSRITATRNKNTWMGTQLLIIDGAYAVRPTRLTSAEISMVNPGPSSPDRQHADSPDFFTKIDGIARAIRDIDEPLCVCGSCRGSC